MGTRPPAVVVPDPRRVRDRVLTRPRVLTWMRRTFAASFVALGARLALADR
ncbi:hypothetical protein SAMN05660359_03111 [Geodermatophilus obscurus]|uniref:Uncharacterized protein n=1 Tax=Geodermatophilus obscurus TaxID=1861 RepID=A0A1I5GT47_9ACTN|nr:hypothetical protein [Geodermatophilus obscurus]SFO39109.1 hypothetical protein SAMN05660359_03111 [Geodermatophilus obscurus]